MKFWGSGQVVDGIVRVMVPQRARVDQRAVVNVDQAFEKESNFVETDADGGLDVAPRKLLEKVINAHCGRGEDSAGAAEKE